MFDATYASSDPEFVSIAAVRGIESSRGPGEIEPTYRARFEEKNTERPGRGFAQRIIRPYDHETENRGDRSKNPEVFKMKVSIEYCVQ